MVVHASSASKKPVGVVLSQKVLPVLGVVYAGASTGAGKYKGISQLWDIIHQAADMG